MDGQISIFDYMDEKQNINIISPHITIENLYVAQPEPKKPKKKTSERSGAIAEISFTDRQNSMRTAKNVSLTV